MFFLARKSEYLLREMKKNIEKTHCVSIKIKHEKDVRCKMYCCFGEILFFLL